jgi:hypothetical protein
MLMMKERRTPSGRWARSVLLETGAIRECEEHGWMRGRAACSRASYSHRSRGPSALSLSGGGSGGDRRRAWLDRRHLPGECPADAR